MEIEELKVHNVYFCATYFDEGLTSSQHRNVFFLGIDFLSADQTGECHFQEAEKFIELGEWNAGLDAIDGVSLLVWIRWIVFMTIQGCNMKSR